MYVKHWDTESRRYWYGRITRRLPAEPICDVRWLADGAEMHLDTVNVVTRRLRRADVDAVARARFDDRGQGISRGDIIVRDSGKWVKA